MTFESAACTIRKIVELTSNDSGAVLSIAGAVIATSSSATSRAPALAGRLGGRHDPPQTAARTSDPMM